VGAGSQETITGLAAKIAQIMEKQPRTSHAPPRAGDVQSSLADLRRAGEDLGYRPITDLEHGLKPTIEWLLCNQP
jgi:nucleoside-diphosphate-sugar epimerase